jgi:GNAT superfamily N-acetyltransferase
MREIPATANTGAAVVNRCPSTGDELLLEPARIVNGGYIAGMDLEIIPVSDPDSVHDTVLRATALEVGVSVDEEDVPVTKVFLARLAGREVGLLMVDLLPSKELHVAALHVVAEHQQKGVGTRLLQHAEEYARARGCREVVLDPKVTGAGLAQAPLAAWRRQPN